MDENNANSFSVEQEIEVNFNNTKCPNCGNNLKFNPETQKLYCEYCDSEISFEQDSNYQEISLNNAIGVNQTWDSTAKVYICENCNAKIVLSKGETASLCPFCGTAHVISSDELPGVKPNVVVPFMISNSKATDNLKAWAKRKLFAPSDFKKKISPNDLKGVYMPCYTFDSNTYSTYEGRIGVRHTRTVGSGKNRRTETYIVWHHIHGVYEHFFDDVTISASERFTQKQISSLGGYSAQNNKVYEDKFLLGYMAYSSDKAVEPCWNEAKGVIDNNLRRLILSQYHYDVVSYLNVSTTHSNVTYKYVMVPVYIGSYKYGKKMYGFMTNGVTGKTKGKAPVSPWRVLVAVLLGIGLIIGTYFIATASGCLEEASTIAKDAVNLLSNNIII